MKTISLRGKYVYMEKKERCNMMRRDKKMTEQKPSIEKNLEKILTSGKTAGEMLAGLKTLMPQFDFEEVDA